MSANNTPQTLPFTQNWSNVALITSDDNWSEVPGIVGYRGDDLTTAFDTDLRTITADGSTTPVDVNANRNDPDAFQTGGIVEFDGIANPTIAIQGTGTADVPHIVIYLNTTGQSNIQVAFNARDIDAGSDAAQQLNVQYRVGGSGFYANLAGGYYPDVTAAGATQVTAVSLTLPAAANNQPLVEIRIMTTNATGSDEFIGIDDINIFNSQPCTYSLSLSDIYLESNGGNAGAVITTQPGCPWTAISNTNWITVNNSNGSGNGTINFSVSANTGAARIGTITIGGKNLAVSQQAAPTTPTPTPFPSTPTPTPKHISNDFDGDGKTDFSIFRAIFGEWWFLKSSDGGNAAFQFGASTDKIVPADYTGDGKTDIAFYRDGFWFILRSEDFSYYAFPFGLTDDVPTPSDYDGDGKADPAVFRPSTNVWYIMRSTGGNIIVWQFGSDGDIPVAADYNGDRLADIAVYTPSLGKWQIQVSTVGLTSFQFGTITDKPVPADYEGGGRTNAAYYRPSTNEWFILRSNGTTLVTQFGTAGDIATPGDYDGDGKTDIAIYRPSTTYWWYAASSANGQHRAVQFGLSTDKPVPSAYVH